MGLRGARISDRDEQYQALARFHLSAQRFGQNSGRESFLRADTLQVGRMGSAQTTRQIAPELNSQWAGASSESNGILEAFVNTCRRWRLERRDQVVLLGYSAGDPIGKEVLTGRILPFSRDVDDRAAYVVAISIGLGILFEEDAEAENQWLRLPRARFGEVAPLDFMLEGSMGNLIAVNDLVERERGF